MQAWEPIVSNNGACRHGNRHNMRVLSMIVADKRQAASHAIYHTYVVYAWIHVYYIGRTGKVMIKWWAPAVNPGKEYIIITSTDCSATQKRGNVYQCIVAVPPIRGAYMLIVFAPGLCVDDYGCRKAKP